MNNMTDYIWIHVIAAAVMLSLTVLQLILSKGTAFHKVNGYIWSVSVFVIALSSFGIREVGGIFGFSWIHGLSVYVLIGLPMTILYARRGDIRLHRKNMLGLIIGMSIAGVFTLVPGRRLGDFLWGV